MRLIDADALEQKFSEIKHYLTKDLVMDAVYEINKAPTIDPVKHGHWKYPLGMAWNYVCSECGANGGVKGTPFCPSCGARMDGSHDN